MLPDPCVNLAIEPDGVGLYGVTSGRSTHVLAGAGAVVGTKFRPGGFSGFLPAPVRELNDRVLTLGEAFGADGEQIDHQLAGAETTRELIDLVSAFLRAHRPPPDPQRSLAAEIVEAMRAAPPGTRVAAVAARFSLAPRTLQRLFAAHVGARPKQVLQRFRHQHATDQLVADHGAPVPASRAWPPTWATSTRPTSSRTSAPPRDGSRPRLVACQLTRGFRPLTTHHGLRRRTMKSRPHGTCCRVRPIR